MWYTWRQSASTMVLRCTRSSSPALQPLFEVLDEVAAAMRRANHQVEMCYEAPWSAKVSSKKVPPVRLERGRTQGILDVIRTVQEENERKRGRWHYVSQHERPPSMFRFLLHYYSFSTMSCSRQQNLERRKKFPFVRRKKAIPSIRRWQQERRWWMRQVPCRLE